MPRERYDKDPKMISAVTWTLVFIGTPSVIDVELGDQTKTVLL